MEQHMEDMELLGAPLTAASGARMLVRKTEELALMCTRSASIRIQDAVILLRQSLFAPRLMYLLRCSPTDEHEDALVALDTCLHTTLEKVLNARLPARSFEKATLPIRAGGLGVRKATSLALACYVSSLHASKEAACTLLPHATTEGFKTSVTRVARRFRELWPDVELSDDELADQSRLDELGWKKTLEDLLQGCSGPERAGRSGPRSWRRSSHCLEDGSLVCLSHRWALWWRTQLFALVSVFGCLSRRVPEVRFKQGAPSGWKQVRTACIVAVRQENMRDIRP